MRLKESLKSSFLAGVVLVGPLVATLVILRFVTDILAGQLQPIVEGTRLATYTANNELLAQLVALVLLFVAVTVLGAFAKRPIGQHVFGRTGRLVNFVPIFRTIYGSVRQMANSVATRSSDFEAAVYVEYEWEGLYRLGLQTGTSPSDLEQIAGEPARNVFIPTSPNPTGGALVLVPESRVHDADLSVRAALRIIMTTGMADTPKQHVVQVDDDEFPPGDASQTDRGDDQNDQNDERSRSGE